MRMMPTSSCHQALLPTCLLHSCHWAGGITNSCRSLLPYCWYRPLYIIRCSSFANKVEIISRSPVRAIEHRRGREPPFIFGRIVKPQRGDRFVVSPTRGFFHLNHTVTGAYAPRLYCAAHKGLFHLNHTSTGFCISM